MKSATLFRNGLLAVFLLLLLLPWLQKTFSLFTTEPLKGHFQKTAIPELTINNWLEGSFQENYEAYLTENTGFHEPLVRLHNQIDYSFFDIIHAEAVVLGKNGYLYDLKHLNAYSGKDFKGAISIRNQVAQIRFIQDQLKAYNKTVLLVFAPGKASFFPEYLPDGFSKTAKCQTNVLRYLKEVQDQQIHHIDFYHYLLDQKRKSPYPLFPKYGIHWSKYASCLVTDSLIKHLEELYHIDMPNVFWKRILKEEAHDTDVDLLDLMNLWKQPELPEMGYPEVRFEDGKSKSKPSVLVIADSYYWGIDGNSVSKAFSNYHFWFYNNEVHPTNAGKQEFVYMLNLREQIAQHDIIIVLSADANLYEFGWGFFHNMEQMLRKPESRKYLRADYNRKLNKIRDGILGDRNWYRLVEEKARQKHISTDSMIRLDAQWLYHQYLN